MSLVEEAVILAGGKSIRFGRDKLTYRIDGKEILVRVIEAAQAVAGKVVLSVRREEDGERLSKLTGLEYRVDEPLPCTGPIRGVLSSIKRENTLLLPADLPWMDGDALRSFLDVCESFSAQICGLLWSSTQKYLDPMIALIKSTEPLVYVRRACGLKGVRVTDVHRAASSIAMVSAGMLVDPWRFLDVDRPEDLILRDEEREGWNEEILLLIPRNLGNPYRKAIEGLERGSLDQVREMFNLELGMFRGVENVRAHVAKDIRSLGEDDGGCDR